MRLIVTLFLTFFVLISTSKAQTVGTAAASSEVTKVHAIVPQEAVACLSVRMQQIKLDEALRLLPWEIASAASLDEIGIDLSEIERFDLFVGPIAEPPGIAGVITGKNKLDLTRLNKDLFRAREDGESYQMLGDREMRNIHVVPLSDKQVLVGHADTIGPFINAQRGAGDLLKQMQRLGENGHVSLVFVPGPVRSLLLQGIESLPPEEAADFKVLAEKVQLVAARTQIQTNLVINVLIETANEADAQSVETSWNRLVELNVRQFTRNFGGQVRDPALAETVGAYTSRALKEMKDLLRPTRKGTRLLLNIDYRAINLTRGIATFMNLRPALASSRPRGPMLKPVGNSDVEKLKKIGLAIHNYESAYKMLPMGGDTNQRKQTQLSWRVNILPFIGDPGLIQLYQQFKLDEPWDSETNFKLLEKMPDVYRYSMAKVPSGHTVVQMPMGPGLISEAGKTIRFVNVTDGLSNTVLVALTTDEAAVPWTKPDDFNPLENIELIRSDSGNVLLGIADGSIYNQPSASADKLKSLLTIGGGD